MTGVSLLLLLVGVQLAHGDAPPLTDEEFQAARERPFAPFNESAPMDQDKPDETRQKNYIAPLSRRWPMARIPYTMGDGITQQFERDAIAQAIMNIEDNSCIDFVPRTNELAYVEIDRRSDSTGCWAYVGYTGGVRGLNLGSDGCFQNRVVVHELLHSLGAMHEQVRPDRDDCLTIMWDNIKEENRHNFYRQKWEGQGGLATCSDDTVDFDQCVAGGNGVVNDGLAYDCDSVMHYFNTAFTNNGQPTIVAHSCCDDQLFGRSPGLSALDIEKLNKAYSCDDDGGGGGENDVLQPGQSSRTLDAGECIDIMTPGYDQGSDYGKEKLTWLFNGLCNSFGITFEDTFEVLGTTSKCKPDQVLVQPGKSANGKFEKNKNGAAKLCGTTAPSSVTITNPFGTDNRVFFKSNKKDSGVGFRATICNLCTV